MTTKELLIDLNERYPFEYAEKWDNVGLLVGDKNRDTGEIFVSLDVTSETLEQIPNGSTLITHHPLLFKSIKSVDFNSYEGKLIKILIQKDINYIVLHTNYDQCFLNDFYVGEILRITKYERIGSLIYYDVKEAFRKDYVKYLVQTNKQLSAVKGFRFVDSNVVISKVAVCTGSGSSLLREAKANGADLLITGDVNYHTAMEAKEIGVSILDVTHYHSEKYFGVDLVSYLGATKIMHEDPFKAI